MVPRIHPLPKAHLIDCHTSILSLNHLRHILRLDAVGRLQLRWQLVWSVPLPEHYQIALLNVLKVKNLNLRAHRFNQERVVSDWDRLR